MNENTPRGLRWTIRGLSVLLFFLFLWLEGFVVGDLGSMEGPSRRVVESGQVDETIAAPAREARLKVTQLEGEIQRLEQVKSNRIQSRDAASATLNQIQRSYEFEIKQERAPSDELATALRDANQSFLEASGAYEEANQRIGQLQDELNSARVRAEDAESRLQVERDRVNRANGELWRTADARHRFRVAASKMAFVVPMFLFAAWLTVKRKDSILAPIHKALLVASFWWIGVVMFEHFPREFFKYIAIGAAILIVVLFLVRSLRNAAQPQDEVLLRRRREAYQASRCPECAYPVPPETGAAMACASCGVELFGPCGSCSGIRHTLLPHCRTCGDATERWRGTGIAPAGAEGTPLAAGEGSR